jgi:hypothetical protein
VSHKKTQSGAKLGGINLYKSKNYIASSRGIASGLGRHALSPKPITEFIFLADIKTLEAIV